jgi:hypothetical protein
MENYIQIKEAINPPPKAPKKKPIKMRDIFTNPKEPNKIIKIMSKSSSY